MITIDLANTIFLGCLAVGGILLLVTVLVGDLLGGVLDALNLDFDLGGVSFLPVLLGFVAMFGVGGLFGTQALNLSPALASLVGVAFGSIGAGLVVVLFRSLRGQESPGATATASVIGQEGQVSVGIEPGRYGSVIVNFDGAPLQRRATSDRAIAAGQRIRVTSVVGADLVVEPVDAATSGA